MHKIAITKFSLSLGLCASDFVFRLKTFRQDFIHSHKTVFRFALCENEDKIFVAEFAEHLAAYSTWRAKMLTGLSNVMLSAFSISLRNGYPIKCCFMKNPFMYCAIFISPPLCGSSPNTNSGRVLRIVYRKGNLALCQYRRRC